MKIKKIVTLFLSAVLVMGTALGCIAAAETDILSGVGLFDAASLDQIEGWDLYDVYSTTPTTACFSLVPGCDENGNQQPEGTTDMALQINPSADQESRAYLSGAYLSRFAPGETYTVSGWVLTSHTWSPEIDVVVCSDGEGTLTNTILSNAMETLKSAEGVYTANTWQKFTDTFTVPKDCRYATVMIRTTKKNAKLQLDDLKIVGVPAPVSEENETILADGSFSADSGNNWNFTDSSVLKSEADNYYIATDATHTAGTTVTLTGADAYAVTADVKRTDGIPVITVDTNGADEGVNIEKGPFYDRCRDYTMTFGESSVTDTEWEKICFTAYKATDATEIKLTFGAASGAVAYDNIAVKPTAELVSNGSFDGLPFTVNPEVLEEDDKYYLPHGTLQRGAAYTETEGFGGGRAINLSNAADATQDARYEIAVPMKAGKTYKISGMVYSSKTSEPAVYFAGGYSYSGMGNSENETLMSTNDAQLNAAASANTWTTFTMYYTVPAMIENRLGNVVDWPAKEIFVTFKDRFALNTSLVYYLDDLSIQEAGVSFYGKDGKTVSEIESGKPVFAQYTLTSDAETAEKVTLVLALYRMENDTKQLVDFTCSEGEAAADNPTMLYAGLDVPAGDGAYMISAFVMDSLAGLRALGTKYSLE